jgi:hypothetical protein
LPSTESRRSLSKKAIRCGGNDVYAIRAKELLIEWINSERLAGIVAQMVLKNNEFGAAVGCPRSAAEAASLVS